MNKRQIIASLNKIANELDTAKLYNEANIVTKVMSRIAMDDMPKYQNDNFALEDYMPYSDENDDDWRFEQDLFNKQIEGLREIFMPYGDEDDVVGDRMRDYNVDPEQPSERSLRNLFRDLDDIIDDPRSNIFHEQKVNVDGRMVNYKQLKNMILNQGS
jgi:Fe-S-cluster formation regulator IscX/YfhJ